MQSFTLYTTHWNPFLIWHLLGNLQAQLFTCHPPSQSRVVADAGSGAAAGGHSEPWAPPAPPCASPQGPAPGIAPSVPPHSHLLLPAPIGRNGNAAAATANRKYKENKTYKPSQHLCLTKRLWTHLNSALGTGKNGDENPETQLASSISNNLFSVVIDKLGAFFLITVLLTPFLNGYLFF